MINCSSWSSFHASVITGRKKKHFIMRSAVVFSVALQHCVYTLLWPSFVFVNLCYHIYVGIKTVNVYLQARHLDGYTHTHANTRLCVHTYYFMFPCILRDGKLVKGKIGPQRIKLQWKNLEKYILGHLLCSELLLQKNMLSSRPTFDIWKVSYLSALISPFPTSKYVHWVQLQQLRHYDIYGFFQ